MMRGLLDPKSAVRAALLFTPLCAAGAAPGAAAQLEQPDSHFEAWSADQLEVWRTVERWNDAFEANDVPRYFEFIDHDITVLTPSGPFRVDGIAADRREFAFAIDKGYGRVSLFQEFQPRVRVVGDMAFAVYYNRGWYGEGATAKMIHLRETNVLVRRDGAWKIAHIHVSPVP